METKNNFSPFEEVLKMYKDGLRGYKNALGLLVLAKHNVQLARNNRSLSIAEAWRRGSVVNAIADAHLSMTGKWFIDNWSGCCWAIKTFTYTLGLFAPVSVDAPSYFERDSSIYYATLKLIDAHFNMSLHILDILILDTLDLIEKWNEED